MSLFVKLINGNCRNMKEVPNESVHLVVTSPPYLDAINYNRENVNNIGNFTGEEYYKMVYDVYSEVFRVLKPGRRFCLNVQDIPSTEETTGLDMVGFRSALLCQKIGFDLNAIIVWDKGRNRAGGTPMGSVPYPGGVVILGNYEYVFVFRKPGTPEYPTDKDIREGSKLTTQDIADNIYSVWSIRPEMDRSHPAPFPYDLPFRLIKVFSFKGETVLEPFTGSGTTLKAARDSRRSAIGYELEYKFCKMAMGKVIWGMQFIDGGEEYRYEFVRSGQTVDDSETVDSGQKTLGE